jgi:hypothetical protein
MQYRKATVFTKTHPHFNYGQTGWFFQDVELFDQGRGVFFPDGFLEDVPDKYFELRMDDMFFDSSTYVNGLCTEQVFLRFVNGGYKTLVGNPQYLKNLKQIRQMVLDSVII